MRWFWQQNDQPSHDQEQQHHASSSASEALSAISDDLDHALNSSSISTQPRRGKPASDRDASKNESVSQALWKPSTLFATALLTSSILLSSRLYKKRLRRIPNVDHVPPSFYRASVPSTKTKQTSAADARSNWNRTRPPSLFGIVTNVGDADNFRLFHTPGGMLALFPPLPLPFLRRYVPPVNQPSTATSKQSYHGHAPVGQTLHIRIAGIDAPELAHFGRPAQPHSTEALNWLETRLLGKRVRVYLHRRDQYGRAVGTVYERLPWYRLWKNENVGVDMVRAGYATVYEAKYGAEFGGAGIGNKDDGEAALREAEAKARSSRRGIWSGSGGAAGTSGASDGKSTGLRGLWSSLKRLIGFTADEEMFESPREYKTRMAKVEEQRGRSPQSDRSDSCAKKTSSK